MSTPLPRFKIGTNRGRRRIWLDGKRLLEAGFIGGTQYAATTKKGSIICDRTANDLPEGARWRKVTGRPDGKPIIDITGRDVDTAFPSAAEVKVRFEPGRITILEA